MSGGRPGQSSPRAFRSRQHGIGDGKVIKEVQGGDGYFLYFPSAVSCSRDDPSFATTTPTHIRQPPIVEEALTHLRL